MKFVNNNFYLMAHSSSYATVICSSSPMVTITYSFQNRIRVILLQTCFEIITSINFEKHELLFATDFPAGCHFDLNLKSPSNDKGARIVHLHWHWSLDIWSGAWPTRSSDQNIAKWNWLMELEKLQNSRVWLIKSRCSQGCLIRWLLI